MKSECLDPRFVQSFRGLTTQYASSFQFTHDNLEPGLKQGERAEIEIKICQSYIENILYFIFYVKDLL